MSVKKFFQGMVAALALLIAAPSVQADFIGPHVNGCIIEDGVDSRRGACSQYVPLGPELGALFVAYYAFTETGEIFWVQGAGIVEAGQFSVEIPLQLVEGGAFGSTVGAPAVTNDNWGTATYTFNACNDVTWAIDTNDPDFTDFSHNDVSALDLIGGVPTSQCVYQKAFTGCPDFATPGADARTCVISAGEYTQDMVLTNDTLWILNGAVFIGEKNNPDSTNAIWIEPGTRIIGVGQALLGITQGARIYAEGVPHAPIVMTGINTASNAVTPGSRGDWGGLTINGKAPINTCGNPGQCTAQGEGESGPYGGADENDSSGVLRFVRVQFAGILFTDENELNGIAFQGVGRGTVVEYVQVHDNADDGVEFFGGTVNARYLVLTHIGDDSIDWTQGWNGKVQYALIYQDPNLATDAGEAFEMDSNSTDNDATPRALGMISHVTAIGRPDRDGMRIREGTGVKITNSILTGFNNCIDIDGASTFTNGGTPAAPSGNISFENMILNCTNPYLEENGDPYTVQALVEAFPNNTVADPMLNVVYPPDGAGYLTGNPINMDEFPAYFNNHQQIGAFSGDSRSSWLLGWTLQDLMFAAPTP